MDIVSINTFLVFIAGIMLLLLFFAAVIINGIEIMFDSQLGKVMWTFLIGGILAIVIGVRRRKRMSQLHSLSLIVGALSSKIKPKLPFQA